MGWEDRPTFEELQDFPVAGGGRVDLVELLRQEAAVKFVMTRETQDPASRGYRVFTRDGDARIERDELSKALKYSVLSGSAMGRLMCIHNSSSIISTTLTTGSQNSP